MAGHPRSRRSFLRTLTVAGVGGAVLWRFLSPRHVPDGRRVDVRVDEVPLGGALVLPEQGVAVTRTETGAVAVLSLTCTHLGCRLTANEDGFTCPCHGSGFDRDGQVLRGPAKQPLRALRYAIEHDVLHITVEAT